MSTTISQTYNRDTWLTERRQIIGASEIAALINLNRWMSPLDVWQSKVRPVEQPDNEYLKAGRLLEDDILQLYSEETGHTVLPNSDLVRLKDRDFIGCTPDAYIASISGDYCIYEGLVEAKNTARYVESPEHAHYVQLQYQLGVTGLPWGSIAYLSQGYRFVQYQYQRNDALINDLFEVAEVFWRDHVLTGIAPEPRDASDLSKIITQHIDGKMIEAAQETADLIGQLKVKKEEAKLLEKEIEELENSVKLIIRDAEGITYAGQVLTTWKTAAASIKLNEKRLRAEQPDIWKEYAEPRLGSRRFLVK